jgi:hypothetical protein
MNVLSRKEIDDMSSRRSIAERVIARARERGKPIDDDPAFMEMLALWIDGKIDMQDMRSRYTDLIVSRSQVKSIERATRLRQENAPLRRSSPVGGVDDEMAGEEPTEKADDDPADSR